MVESDNIVAEIADTHIDVILIKLLELLVCQWICWEQNSQNAKDESIL